ncbi:MAG: outer membrane beta-barrel protein [Ginsengibacter sp.]
MKKFLLAIALFVASASYAQFPSKPSGMKNSGHVYGKVTDADGKPVEGASVILLHQELDATTKKMKMILVSGVISKSNGDFNFTEVPVMGKLQLRISNSGFKSLQENVAFSMPKMPSGGAQPAAGASSFSAASLPFDKDLGNIKMETEAKTLAAVTIVGSAPSLKMDIDKKVFNVEKNIVSAGGTAVDVMRNVPSVQVDIDGNVKLRNASPQIYVDGHPTTLSLDEIPADAIQSVEVITNPSAKYDASGGGSGILNIVLKKNKASGYNGNVTAGVDSRGGINAGANFNVRQNKFNFTASGMLHQMRGNTTGTTDRTNLGDTLSKVSQSDISKTNGAFVFGKLGLDYYLSNRATISLGAVKVHGNFDPNETINSTTDSLLPSGTKSINSVRYTSGTRSFDANGLQLDYVYNFPKDGEQLTANGNYFSGKTPSNQLYTTNYLDGNSITNTQLQQVTNNGNINFLTMQTDYSLPFGKQKQSKLEAGLKFQQHKTDQNNDNFRGTETNNLVKIPAGTNDYQSTDNVFAGYADVKSTIKNFGYELGLRAESSNYNGELTTTGEKFSNKYPISLFPSLFLSQKLKNNQELQFSYTRRINRPGFFQLIPFTDYTDSLNITRGNPNLVPEFTNSLEMSYSKTFKGGNSFLGSIYYKHSNNLITRYLTPGANPFTNKEDIINTYINANSSYSYGAELTSINKLTNWWDLTTNVNVYQSHINTSNIPGSTSEDAMVSWFGKLNSNFKLPSNFTIQLSGDYQSKTNLPINNSQGGPGGGGSFGQAQSSSQGYIRSIWGTDIAVKKSFLKNNAASLTVSMSDIFRTRIQDQYSESPYFIQNYTRLNNPQLVRVSFAYHFGKMDTNLFKRQNTKAAGTQDIMQMAQ